MERKKVSYLQAWLTILFVTALLASNVLSPKEFTWHGVSATGAIVCFPITYILSDLFSEVYGYKWSRVTCYMAFLMNAFMCAAFYTGIALPASPWWGDQRAFEIVLGNTPRTLLASSIAFVAGDFANDIVFRKMKGSNATMKGFGMRAIISSICGDLIDGCIFMVIAFTGVMTLQQLITVWIAEFLIKIAYEILILPLTTWATKKALKAEQSTV